MDAKDRQILIDRHMGTRRGLGRPPEGTRMSTKVYHLGCAILVLAMGLKDLAAENEELKERIADETPN